MIVGFRDRWLQEFFIHDRAGRIFRQIWKTGCSENCNCSTTLLRMPIFGFRRATILKSCAATSLGGTRFA